MTPIARTAELARPADVVFACVTEPRAMGPAALTERNLWAPREIKRWLSG